MRLAPVLRRLHLWSGLGLAAAILLWTASGLVIAWCDRDTVSGARNAPATLPVELRPETFASPGGVIAQTGGAYRVELTTLQGRPVYRVDGVTGRALFSARSGEPIIVDEDRARELAEAAFVGDGKIARLVRIGNPSTEYRGALPVWRAEFDDRLNTRLYISPETGEVLARRNDAWRRIAVVRRLHGIGNGGWANGDARLVRAAALVVFLFAASGLATVFTPGGRRLLVADWRRLTGRGKTEAPADRS